MVPFSTVSISQCESAIFVTNFRRWNAPLLISLIGLPDKLSLIKAFVCFHDSDGISRIVFSDKSSSIKFVSLLKALGSTKKRERKIKIVVKKRKKNWNCCLYIKREMFCVCHMKHLLLMIAIVPLSSSYILQIARYSCMGVSREMYN